MPRSCSSTAPKTPPLWYVSDGLSVVGPMTTTTLLQGVAFGRVSEDSFVRAHEWERWRNVLQIREVCALRREQDRSGQLPAEGWKPPTPTEQGWLLAQKFLRCAESPGEALLLSLHAGVEATRAEVGMVHRFKGLGQAFVTSFTYGGELEPRVGSAIAGFDPACAAAVDGRGVWGSQGKGPAQRAIVERLGQGASLRGVAMLPVRVMGHTYAMIELGRADHPFRACDKARLAGVRRALESLFVERGWDPWPRGQGARRSRLLLLAS